MMAEGDTDLWVWQRSLRVIFLLYSFSRTRVLVFPWVHSLSILRFLATLTVSGLGLISWNGPWIQAHRGWLLHSVDATIAQRCHAGRSLGDQSGWLVVTVLLWQHAEYLPGPQWARIKVQSRHQRTSPCSVRNSAAVFNNRALHQFAESSREPHWQYPEFWGFDGPFLC